MKRVIFYLLAITSLLPLSSCKESESNSVFWGETKYYKDFLWKKYEPVRMEKTLEIEFNEDAKNFANLWSERIEFNVVNITNNKPFEHIKLYKNDELCNNNVLVITPEDEEVQVAIEFLESAPEGNHILTLVERGNSGLDRIEIEMGDGVVITKKDITNPLALTSSISGSAILIILIVLAVILRLASPKIKHTLTVIEPIAQNIVRRNEARRVVLTSDRKQKQGLISKIFKGKTKYVYNDIWTSTVVLTYANRGIRVEDRGQFEFDPYASKLTYDEESLGIYTLTDPDNNIIKIQIG